MLKRKMEDISVKAHVNPEICSGIGLCVSNCPEVFELTDGIATVKVDEVPAELREACKAAAYSCPTKAISIEE